LEAWVGLLPIAPRIPTFISASKSTDIVDTRCFPLEERGAIGETVAHMNRAREPQTWSSMAPWWVVYAGLLLTLATPCAAAAPPKRVLILDSFGRDVAPFTAGVSAFRTTLAQEFGEPVDFYDASLDAGQFAESEGEGPFVEFLRARFAGRPLDLVVPFGAPAVRFAAQYREHLFPGTPIVFAGVEPRLVPPDVLRINATLVTQKVNLPGMVEDILQMQPDTTNIVVVFGASRLEEFWVRECQREFQAFGDRVRFTWLNDLSLPQVLERSAALPPHSFILFGMFVMDAAGVPFDNDEALRRLRAVANAPIFAYFGSAFGLGAVGGHMYRDSEVGVRGRQWPSSYFGCCRSG
jgi:hypothetical protein